MKPKADIERCERQIARLTVELVKARRAIVAAIEACPCEGVACDWCRPLIAVAVEIGCW